jgi:hypothetical protein
LQGNTLGNRWLVDPFWLIDQVINLMNLKLRFAGEGTGAYPAIKRLLHLRVYMCDVSLQMMVLLEGPQAMLARVRASLVCAVNNATMGHATGVEGKQLGAEFTGKDSFFPNSPIAFRYHSFTQSGHIALSVDLFDMPVKVSAIGIPVGAKRTVKRLSRLIGYICRTLRYFIRQIARNGCRTGGLLSASLGTRVALCSLSVCKHAVSVQLRFGLVTRGAQRAVKDPAPTL